jgi:predicted nucleic acid-binding protein
VRAISTPVGSSLDDLDPGEREAITLAFELGADEAAELGLCILDDAYDRLRQTNFHASYVVV